MKKVLKTTIIILIVMFLFGIGFGGYAIFNRFMKISPEGKSDIDASVNEVKTEKIKGIALDKFIIDGPKIQSYTEMINNFHKALSNEDMYLKEIRSNNNSVSKEYLKSMETYINEEYMKSILKNPSNNIIVDILKTAHNEDNRHIYSLTLVSVNKDFEEDNEVMSLFVDVNSVGDEIGFRVQRLSVVLDDSDKIKKIEVIGNVHEQANTTTPLTKDSGLSNSIGVEFLNEFNLLKRKMSNTNLYDMISLGTINEKSPEWETFVNELNIDSIDKRSLFELFNISKGAFKSYGFVSCEHTYENADPITYYVLKIADENGSKNFKITFKRTTNKIIDLKTVN